MLAQVTGDGECLAPTRASAPPSPSPAPPAPCDSLSATKKQNWVLQDVGPEKGPPAQAPGREPCPRLSSSALELGHNSHEI